MIPTLDATVSAAKEGMASGAQLMPLAQQIAQQISSGLAPMPSTTDGWNQMVRQYVQPDFNTLAGTSNPLASLASPGSKALNASFAQPATAAVAPAAVANSQSASSGEQAFVSQMAPWAKYASAATGLDANLILAQWGNETAWGSSSAWTQNFNPAGIGITDPSVAGAGYGSVKAGVDAYVNFLDANNPNSRYYSVARAGNAQQQAVALGNSGWAAGKYDNGSGPGSDLIQEMQSLGANADGAQSASGVAANTVAPSENMGSQTVVNFAQSKIGDPYVWGGESDSGYDCSGLVQAAYKATGVNLPRVAQAQYDATTKVPSGQALQPGDLVFFGADTSSISHVGIYVGGGQMIDAPNSDAKVRTESYQWADYVGATRPVDNTGATTAAVPTATRPAASIGNFSQVLSQVQSALNSAGAH